MGLQSFMWINKESRTNAGLVSQILVSVALVVMFLLFEGSLVDILQSDKFLHQSYFSIIDILLQFLLIF